MGQAGATVIPLPNRKCRAIRIAVLIVSDGPIIPAAASRLLGSRAVPICGLTLVHIRILPARGGAVPTTTCLPTILVTVGGELPKAGVAQ